jgi:fatty-acyl-CoA synthase/long-chain acyl-CoA synthetase
VIVKGQPDAAASISSGIIPFDDLLRSSPEPVAAEIQPTDPAMILYTSGTTGAPKGAVHSHRTLLMALRLLIAKYRKEMMPSWPLVKNILPALKTVRRVPWLGEVMLTLVDLAQIKLLILTPFYHIAGYFQIVLGVLAGCKLVVLERFHPERALELIRRERVTLVVGVPPMYQAMLERENFARFDLSSVVLMVTTAMATPPQLVRDLRDRIGGFIVIIYGATEIAATTVTVPTDASDKQTDTVGRVAMNGVEVRIVDDQRREVPRGAMGEIAVRAPSMMEGYYKRPDATAEVIDQDGWYYTGDMGQLDAEGYVTVLGRRGDMIIRAGVNVYPAEIENYLLTHPKISQVAVIGLPGPASSGERVVAYVVPKEGDVMEAGDVLAYCWGQIAAFKVPDEVRFVKELPVTSALQKVQHYKLRQQALTEGHQGDNV